MTFTKTQREKAARLWAEGMRMKPMAEVMGVTYEELKYETQAHRDVYPRRYERTVR